MADPMAMRAAVAGYVEGIHRAYVTQADTFPPAVRGDAAAAARGRSLTVAAVGARNLHLLATTEGLGPLRGQEVELPGELAGLDWTLRFYDPVVVPALGLIDESAGPGVGEGPRRAGHRDRRLPRRHPARLRSLAAPRGPRRLRAGQRPLRGGARLRDGCAAVPAAARRWSTRWRAPPSAGLARAQVAAGPGHRPARRDASARPSTPPLRPGGDAGPGRGAQGAR